MPKPSGHAARRALLEALCDYGWRVLDAENDIARLLARMDFARSQGTDMPDWSADTLARSAGDWLLPEGLFSSVPGRGDVRAALLVHLGWDAQATLKTRAPETLSLPSGRAAPIDYLDEKAPLVTARVQEVYGLKTHPTVCGRDTPVTLSLTSPAGRPVALTADLPGFWSGGYVDMAKDMRARYPKHDWPADPSTAAPHEGRTKARLGRP
ncbi:MAG: ATP-dependent helicase C-terminal domain-containing protein [Pseudomonadota bacterium]